MSLKFKILDERNTATVTEKGQFEFFEGENRTLRVQIFESVDDSGYFIEAGGTVEFTFPGSPSNLNKTGSIDSNNRSVITTDLIPLDLTTIVSGNLIAEIDEFGNKRIVKSNNVLKKLSKVPA